ncbi:MAG: hypothetical protein K2N24_06170 [Lachnospiraceae bacterium]|nr:hypothetical protein [Lachnospiraceae bacterium]
MHQKRNEIIAISIFTAALVLLLIWIGLLCFIEEEPEDMPAAEDRMSVVLDGMELLVPREYHCYPADSDLLIYNNSGFSIRLGVREDSYEDFLLRKDTLIPDVESKGYVCTSALEERMIDNRSYLFFTIDTEDGGLYMIYSNAGSDSHFGILVDADEEDPDEVLERIHVLIDSAQETDQENTNIYDLLLTQAGPVEHENQVFYSNGNFRDAEGRDILTYGIPEGFYAGSSREGEIQNYTNRDAAIYVTLSLKSGEDSAEEWIQRYMEFSHVSQINGKQEAINGRTVYYFSEEHERIWEEEREQYYYFYAAIDLEEGLVYWLKGYSLENEKALELESYTEFLTVEELD